MSKREKDWTFVNEDGSVQIEKNHVVYASAQVHNETKLESDSDQDFEIVPTAKENKNDELLNFKGIVVKEDHFADEIHDDGSDIEVVKSTELQYDDDATIVDDPVETMNHVEMAYEKITFSDSIDSDELNEIEKPVFIDVYEKILNEETDGRDLVEADDINVQNVDLEQEDWPEFWRLYDSDSENEFDGLTELFDEHDSDFPTQSTHDALRYNGDEIEADFGIETSGIDDGIILSTSVFIIVLCLSVTAGLFIGKGLTYVSTPTQTTNIAASESSNDVILQERSNENQPKVIVIVNNSMHELNYTTIWMSKNAKSNSFDIALAYREIQEKYAKLQTRYKELNQQYHIQQHVHLLSKKRNNFPKYQPSCKKQTVFKREYPKVCFRKAEETMKLKENKTDLQKELFWWKTRTAIWRQKYLDLKVEEMRGKKKCSLMAKRNITFNNCARLFTQYFPDFDMSSLFKSSTGERLKKSAKICLKKVFTPVEAMKNKMKDGIVYFGKNVDDAWGKLREKWDEKRSTVMKDSKESMKSRLSLKLRRFKKVFSISNIIGTTLWKKNENFDYKKEEENINVKSTKKNMFCNGRSKISKEFHERWKFDAKNENDVTYPPPVVVKAKKQMIVKEKKVAENEINSLLINDNEDIGDNQETATNPKQPGLLKYDDKIVVIPGFKSCANVNPKPDISYVKLQGEMKEKDELLTKRIRDFEDQIKVHSAKQLNEEERIRDAFQKFQAYKAKKEKELEIKKKTLEERMRKSSNKYRKEQNSLKNKAEKMNKVVRKMQEELENLMAEKMNVMKKKNKNLKRKLKSFKKKAEKVKEDVKKTLKVERKKNKKLLELKKKKMRGDLEKEKELFAKWKEEEKGKLKREMAEKWDLYYEDKKKWKERRENLVSKIHKLMKSKREKIHKKEKELNKKVSQLKKALTKLLEEESEKFQEIREKNRKLKQKQDQIELTKFFYTFGLRKEKEKFEKSKQAMKQMKERTAALEKLYNEIMEKYEITQRELLQERSKRKKDKDTIHQMYYPTVYCPDQKYCQHDEVTNHDDQPPIVYCPRKDFCTGWGKKGTSGSRHEKDEYKNKVAENINPTNHREKTAAVKPIPPKTQQQLSKINPFFIDLQNLKNTSSMADAARKQRRKKTPVRPELKKNGDWYFTSMKAKENQKGIPYSWYLYWSRGRENWRSSPGKNDEDNWYLKFMQERERQRSSSPVSWYFKQGKQNEEEEFNDHNNNWILHRGKGRKEAREKEGFYYCW